MYLFVCPKAKGTLTQNPSWFNVLGVEEDDIKDCCYRMICLYNRKKKTIEELEGVVEERKKERKKMDDERRAAREQNLSSGSLNTPAQSSPNSRAVSPGGKSQDDKTTSEAEKSHQNGGKNGGNGSDKSMDLDDRSPSRHKSMIIETGRGAWAKRPKKVAVQGHAVEVLHHQRKESMDTIITRIRGTIARTLETVELKTVGEGAWPQLAFMMKGHNTNIEMDVIGIGTAIMIEKTEIETTEGE